MSKRSQEPSYSSVGDSLWQALESLSKTAAWLGLAAMLVGLGFLIYTYSVVAGMSSGPTLQQASQNIGLFHKILMGGTILLWLGISYQFWGEETLGVLQLMAAAAMYFAPLLLPQALGGGGTPSAEGLEALGAIQSSGLVGGAIAILVLLIDVANRIRMRSQQGMRAEALKYGKGLKEETEIQNVFLGKCWQLPFCRKFVRERCPIYHSKRTCWRELTGCMCEEQVIRDAMEGKVIPKDMVAAAQFIPRNNKLTIAQKQERCKSCVIYNEHQKHKYKALLPVITVAFAGIYLAFRGPLLIATTGLIASLDRMIGRATFRETSGVKETISTSGIPFQEILLVCAMVILFAYALKLLEFLVFKLKV